MGAIVSSLFSVVGEYGVTVALFVFAMQCIVLPFDILARKNRKAKAIAEPRIKKIRKKYGVNALGGFDPGLANELDPAVRSMSEAEKEKQMGIEVDGVYSETGYRPFTGFIPGVLRFVFIILLYIGIRQACPEGMYCIGILNDGAGTQHTIAVLAVMMWAVCFDVIVPLCKVLRTVPADKRKKAIIAPIAGGILSVGLTAWVAFRAMLATIVGMLVLHVTSTAVQWLRDSERS